MFDYRGTQEACRSGQWVLARQPCCLQCKHRRTVGIPRYSSDGPPLVAPATSGLMYGKNFKAQRVLSTSVLKRRQSLTWYSQWVSPINGVWRPSVRSMQSSTIGMYSF